MSIFGTMRTGVPGMNAQANRLGTVGDNIANSSTVGYKRASTAFSSMVLPSSAGNYNSGGVSSNVRYSISEQGGFSYTSSPTDLAIDGDGFFIVTASRDPDAPQYLTRAGSFTRETVEEPAGSGIYKTFLKNSAGYYLFTPSQATASNNRFPGSVVEIPGDDIQATPSTSGALSLNLNNETAVGGTFKTSLTGYGYQGKEIVYDVTYTKTGDNAWTVSVTDTGTGTEVIPATPITFDPSTGAKVTGTNDILTIPAVAGRNAAISLDISGAKQLASKSDIISGGLNGSGAASVTEVVFNEDGSIDLKYDNDAIVSTGSRIMLATVTSPDNLVPINGNAYSASNTSGVLIANDPGSKGTGNLLISTLETSNVDIANELTEMIEAQRIYSANSKVFQTGSELLDVLVNLKR